MINPQYLQLAQQKLSEFARQDDFATKMELAFGLQVDLDSQLCDNFSMPMTAIIRILNFARSIS
jgi:hypothetical protein